MQLDYQRADLQPARGTYHGKIIFLLARCLFVDTVPAVVDIQGGVFTVPFPYWHLLNVPPSTPEEEVVSRAIFQLDLLFKTVTHPKDVAAIFIEPVLGHG